MNYQELINQSIGNVYQAGIATKILQHMGRIRNSSDTNQARRWVMELLQNARDVAWKDEMVKVKIELTDRELKFSHTGKPFRVKDILSIVNQVSSKVDDENTVGQFGTGFVTTFQLSEQVCLEGVLKEEGLPYKAFKINIDRQGDTKDEILTSIERAMDALREVDATSEIANYDKNAFNTTFTYVLKGENNRTIAKIGMEDLKETIFFVLLFSKKIGSVELKYALEGKEKTVCYTQGVHKKVGEKLCTAEFFCTGENNEKQKYEICYMEKDGMTLAANYCEEQGFLPISENCARIFIDFPLVGAEKFCFPVVINNLKLQPNEPRSGISLVDNANSKDAQINKELLKEAVECYREFLGAAHQLSFQGLEHIIKIPFYEYSKEMSEQWVKCNIYKKIYKFCASLPILKTSAGMKPLNHAEVYLLKAKTPEFLEELKEVLHPIANMYYSMDDVDWYRTFEAYEPLEEKIYSLEKLLDEEENLIRSEGKVDIQKISIVKWCEAICKFALKDEELSRKIRAGELAVFPTQKLQDGKVWYLKKMQEICIDPKIPEILKDVTEILDNMPRYDLSVTTQNCCIREHLLHKDFVLEEFSGLMTYEWSRLGNYIEAKSSETFKIADYRSKPVIYKNMRKDVWKLMVSCGPDKEMYDLFVQFSDEEIPEYEFFETPLSNRVWKNTYHGLLMLCVNEIYKAKKLENLRWYGSAKCLDIYAWMNLFYKKWSAYQYVNEDYVWEIYLNQEGNFRLKSELMWDKITAKELKSIAYGLRELSLNCNYYQKLVHEKIEESTLYFQICKDANIAVTINQTVTQLLAQKNLADASMEQQEACSLLLAWIQNNEREAEQYFAAYCSEEGLMKLLTPKAAARMHQKVHKLEQMLELLGCENEEMAFEMLLKMTEERQNTEEKTFAFFDGDVLFDIGLFGNEFDLSDEETLRKVCQEIGVAGEQYVFHMLKQFYEEQNLKVISETAYEIKFESKEEGSPRTVIVIYPNDKNYHQAGWDICVNDSLNNGKTDYIEIKTHTKKSYLRRQISMSNEQMKMAIAKKEHYHVIVVLYDYPNKKGEELTVYKAFLNYIQSGELKNIQQNYVFYV